jgi:hypothetical protein
MSNDSAAATPARARKMLGAQLGRFSVARCASDSHPQPARPQKWARRAADAHAMGAGRTRPLHGLRYPVLLQAVGRMGGIIAASATHLLHVDGRLVDRASATTTRVRGHGPRLHREGRPR